MDVGGYDPQTLHQIQGPTYRQIIDLSHLDQSLFIAPIGQSGNPFSRYYSDLLKKWRDLHYIRIPTVTACQLGDQDCLILRAAN